VNALVNNAFDAVLARKKAKQVIEIDQECLTGEKTSVTLNINHKSEGSLIIFDIVKVLANNAFDAALAKVKTENCMEVDQERLACEVTSGILNNNNEYNKKVRGIRNECIHYGKGSDSIVHSQAEVNPFLSEIKLEPADSSSMYTVSFNNVNVKSAKEQNSGEENLDPRTNDTKTGEVVRIGEDEGKITKTRRCRSNVISYNQNTLSLINLNFQNEIRNNSPNLHKPIFKPSKKRTNSPNYTHSSHKPIFKPVKKVANSQSNSNSVPIIKQEQPDTLTRSVVNTAKVIPRFSNFMRRK